MLIPAVQISYLNALRFGLKRIFFGGFFIRGHAYTMDTISFAVQFWYILQLTISRIRRLFVL